MPLSPSRRRRCRQALRARSLAVAWLLGISTLVPAQTPGTQAVTWPAPAAPSIELRQGRLWLRAADGTEAVVARDVEQPLSFAVCDLDRDGRLDLVVGGVATVRLYRGGVAGWPERGFEFSAESRYAAAIRCADADGDGWNDLLVAHVHGPWRVFLQQAPGLPSARSEELAADVDSFPTVPPPTDPLPVTAPPWQPPSLPFASAPETLYLGGAYPRALAASDLDQDGDPDLVLLNGRSGSLLQVLINDGLGHFLRLPPLPLPEETMALALHDMDGDGKLDLVRVVSRGRPKIHQGIGNGRFVETPVEVGLSDADGLSLVIGDVDGDGLPDLVAGNRQFHRRYLALPGGGYVGRRINRLPRPARAVALADLDGDGDEDLLALGGGTDGQLLLLRRHSRD